MQGFWPILYKILGGKQKIDQEESLEQLGVEDQEEADKDEDSNVDSEHAVITITAVEEVEVLLERANEGPRSEDEIIPAPDTPCQEDALSSNSTSNRAPKKKSRTRNLRRYT